MSDNSKASLAKLPVLTEDDVLMQVRAVLKHGHGTVQVEITEGYIRVIRPTATILGRRP